MEREQRTEIVPERLNIWKIQYHNSKHVQHQIRLIVSRHLPLCYGHIHGTGSKNTFSHNLPLPLFHFFPWSRWRGRRCLPHFAFVMVKINLSFPQNVLELRRASVSRLMHLGTRGMPWSHRRQERISHRQQILKGTKCMQCKSRNRETGQEILGASLSTGRKQKRNGSSLWSLLWGSQSITTFDSQYRRNHYPLLSMQPRMQVLILNVHVEFLIHQHPQGLLLRAALHIFGLKSCEGSNGNAQKFLHLESASWPLLQYYF